MGWAPVGDRSTIAESSMAETEVAFEVEAFGVRTAMSEAASHPDQEIPIDRSIRFSVVIYASDAAHGLTLLRRRIVLERL
jgi:hypothetical protein